MAEPIILDEKVSDANVNDKWQFSGNGGEVFAPYEFDRFERLLKIKLNGLGIGHVLVLADYEEQHGKVDGPMPDGPVYLDPKKMETDGCAPAECLKAIELNLKLGSNHQTERRQFQERKWAGENAVLKAWAVMRSLTKERSRASAIMETWEKVPGKMEMLTGALEEMRKNWMRPGSTTKADVIAELSKCTDLNLVVTERLSIFDSLVERAKRMNIVFESDYLDELFCNGTKNPMLYSAVIAPYKLARAEGDKSKNWKDLSYQMLTLAISDSALNQAGSMQHGLYASGQAAARASAAAVATGADTADVCYICGAAGHRSGNCTARECTDCHLPLSDANRKQHYGYTNCTVRVVRKPVQTGGGRGRGADGGRGSGGGRGKGGRNGSNSSNKRKAEGQQGGTKKAKHVGGDAYLAKLEVYATRIEAAVAKIPAEKP